MPQKGPQTDALLKADTPELFFGGSRGGGKTSWLLGDYGGGVPVYGPNWFGVFFRRTYPELEEVIRQAHEIYPRTGATWHHSAKEYRWPNGAVLQFRYLERDADVHRYQGRQWTWIGFDELTNWPTDYAYRAIMACLRWTAADVPTKRLRASGNPGGVGHHWVKARFVDPAPTGYVPIKDPQTGMVRMFIPSRVTDNKLLLEKDPEYVARLKGIGSQELVRAWLEGDWSVTLGAYFPEFSVDRHVVKPFPIPAEWMRIAGFDWGSARPFSMHWAAVSTGEGVGEALKIPRGAIVVYKEGYGGDNNEGWKWHSARVADWLLKVEGDDKPVYRRADPACWQESGGPSVAEVMAGRGLRFSPGDNKRIPGWDQIRARLVGEDDKPMLYIFSTCTHLIRTLPAAQHDIAKPEDLDTDGEDHALDSLRMIVTSRPYARPKKTAPEDITRRPTINEMWAAKEGDREWT